MFIDTTTPNEVLENADLSPSSKRLYHLYQKAVQLITFLDQNPETLTRLSPATREVTEYMKRGRGKLPRSKKGGKAPLEFNAVETKIDLEAALRTYNTKEVIRNYHRLAKMVGW